MTSSRAERLRSYWELSKPRLSALAVFAMFAVAFGLVAGSFANVAIRRLPEGESLWWPASHCPRCHTPIAVSDNIPVLSWLRLGGACRHCRTAIPRSYPLIETLGGLLGLLLFWRVFQTPLDHDLAHWAAFFGYGTFLTLLIIPTIYSLIDDASSFMRRVLRSA